ncbi:MAG: elongation factor Ts [Candidatus Puniceispirillum sp.]|nr:elongation factor Ts [Candidatus Pelagibacter sp.]MBA4283726.1 elongation factor Ts [Candidatus Puniceispirillum sp.]
MTDITPQMVKLLREKSGAGMMDCKKALTEVNGDIEEAVTWLRKKGLAAAAKKSGRVASEGLVGVAQSSDFKTGCVIEVNSETDFIAKNDQFQKMVSYAATTALSGDFDGNSLLSQKYEGTESATIGEEITRLIAVIGENMQFRRLQKLSVSSGVVATYVHGAVTPGLGSIGVAVALESSADQQELLALGRKIAMHIAATQPISLCIEEVDPAIVEKEKAILTEQAKASGRPDDVIKKMVEGRIDKFYKESVLLEQEFVMDPKLRIKDLISEFSKTHNTPLELKAYTRFLLGDGIEKEESNFAEEVKAQANAGK